MALVGLAVGVWSGGRFFRERRALKEEMELVAIWEKLGDSSQLRDHVDEQLRRYLIRAKNRDHSFRGLFGEFLLVGLLTYAVFSAILALTGALDLLDMAKDPWSYFLVFLIVMVTVTIWRIDRWCRNWWTSRQVKKNRGSSKFSVSE